MDLQGLVAATYIQPSLGLIAFADLLSIAMENIHTSLQKIITNL